MKLYTQYSNVMKINIIDGSGVCKGRKGGGGVRRSSKLDNNKCGYLTWFN